MMNTVKEKWPEIIEHLRVEHELSNVSFNTWIQPLKVYDVVDNTVFILVNMNASVEYIEKKYQLPLKVCIAETTGTEYDVVFISEDDDRLNEIQNMAIEANQKKKSKSGELYHQICKILYTGCYHRCSDFSNLTSADLRRRLGRLDTESMYLPCYFLPMCTCYFRSAWFLWWNWCLL